MRDLFILLSLALCTTGLAQPSITLQEALAKGLANRTDVNIERIGTDIQNERMAQSVGAYLPQLEATFDGRYNVEQQTNVLPGEFFGTPGTQQPVVFGTKWNASAGLSLTQRIYDPNASSKIRIARMDAAVQQSRVAIAEDEARITIAEAWYQVVLSQAGVDLAERALEQCREAYGEDSARAAQGSLLTIELERSSLDLGTAQRKVDRAQRDLRLDRERLAQAIGWMEAQPPTATADVGALLADSLAVLETIDAYLRPEVREALLVLARDSSALSNEQRGWLPTVELYGSVNRHYFSDHLDVAASGTWFPWTYAGIRLSLPLLEGTARTHRIREQRHRVEQQQLREHDLQRTLALETSASRTEYALRREELRDAQAEFDHGIRVLEVDRARLAQGTITQAELMRTRSDVQENNERLYQAIYEFLSAGILVKRSTGIW